MMFGVLEWVKLHLTRDPFLVLFRWNAQNSEPPRSDFDLQDPLYLNTPE